MATISYEAQIRRLRVSGACDAADAPRIGEAVLAFAHGTTLVVDLTAVTDLADAVAEALVRAQADAGRCRVTLIRKSGSAVDLRLHADGR